MYTLRIVMSLIVAVGLPLVLMAYGYPGLAVLTALAGILGIAIKASKR